MEEFLLPIKSKDTVSENILSVTFDTKGTDFSFLSGQYISIRLIDPVHEDHKNNIRSFSIVNPPHILNEVTIVMRLSDSGFSKNILEIAPGTLAAISKPMGNLNLEKNSNVSDVFIAGGVGITPFKSMIEDLLNQGHENEIILFYSNRSKNSAAFIKEFFQLSVKYKNFRFIPVFDEVSDEEPNDLKYEKGFIDHDMMKRHIEDLKVPVFHIAGPPLMVESVINILRSEGIDLQNILTEKY